MMRWDQLLSTHRLGSQRPARIGDHRSPFEIDVDRFVFCSAFRRLQSKMQVHGPSLLSAQPDDYVRNRLTHSLEVSRVARSLGQMAGADLADRGLLDGVTPSDVGHIVSGGAICHDVGHAPFSHEGEFAIARWWSKAAVAARVLEGLPQPMAWELTRFEGNAFGFRLLTRLEGWKPDGGLQQTSALLAAMTKYPWSGGLAPERRPHPAKYGFFTSEADLFAEVAAATGLIEQGPGIWCRHPLAYLTEAADDICYLIVDIEDAVEVGALSFAEGEAMLAPLAEIEAADYAGLDSVERRLTYLRARAIATLIGDTLDVWRAVHDRLLAGEPVTPLLNQSRHGAEIAAIIALSRRKIYRGDARSETVMIANRTLTILLDTYAAMLLRRETSGSDADLDAYDQALLSILTRRRGTNHPFPRDRVGWVRELMDHVAALTDGAAIREAKLLAGGIGV